jgi:hypothetical protein
MDHGLPFPRAGPAAATHTRPTGGRRRRLWSLEQPHSAPRPPGMRRAVRSRLPLPTRAVRRLAADRSQRRIKCSKLRTQLCRRLPAGMFQARLTSRVLPNAVVRPPHLAAALRSASGGERASCGSSRCAPDSPSALSSALLNSGSPCECVHSHCEI